MRSKVAVLTFAMLILNSVVRSFEKRELLVVDECHNLENQIASMFAPVNIAPSIFPERLQNKYWYRFKDTIPKSSKIEDYLDLFDEMEVMLKGIILEECRTYSEANRPNDFLSKLEYMKKEIKDGRTWVIDNGRVKFNGSFERRVVFKPIKVDRFLRWKVWSQANKIILSTATVPFRKNIKSWLYRLGLGDKSFELFSAPMTFPIENRPIIVLNGGRMTKEHEEKGFEKNLKIIKEIIKKHASERGVIHTQSYNRAKRLFSFLGPKETFLHDKNKINGDVIQAWIKSKKRILLSPAIKEGVDLKNDLCRFQILLKVPYPSFGDPRVKYLLNEKKAWNWYFNEASRDITQIYGRAIRSEEDHATFYIIDASFKDLLERSTFPSWFEEAIIEMDYLEVLKY